MATHSSILAWRIPQTEKPGGLQSIGSQRVGHNWSDLAWNHTHLYGTFLTTDHLLQAALSEYSIQHIAEHHVLRYSFVQIPLTCITSYNSLILLAGLSFLHHLVISKPFFNNWVKFHLLHKDYLGLPFLLLVSVCTNVHTHIYTVTLTDCLTLAFLGILLSKHLANCIAMFPYLSLPPDQGLHKEGAGF